MTFIDLGRPGKPSARLLLLSAGVLCRVNFLPLMLLTLLIDHVDGERSTSEREILQ